VGQAEHRGHASIATSGPAGVAEGPSPTHRRFVASTSKNGQSLHPPEHDPADEDWKKARSEETAEGDQEAEKQEGEHADFHQDDDRQHLDTGNASDHRG
jgi:hypothetical protein